MEYIINFSYRIIVISFQITFDSIYIIISILENSFQFCYVANGCYDSDIFIKSQKAMDKCRSYQAGCTRYEYFLPVQLVSKWKRSNKLFYIFR